VIRGKVRSLVYYPESEDIFSEILLALHEIEFKGNSDVGTLIYKITKNKITDYLRRKYKMKEVQYDSYFMKNYDDDFYWSEPEHNRVLYYNEKDGIKEIEDRLHVQYLLSLIKNEKYRKAIILRYFNEWETEEIAKYFSVTSKTVNDYVRKGINQIRKMEGLNG